MVSASCFDIPVVGHVSIYWTPDSFLFIWCFGGNINSSRYFCICTRSLLITGLTIQLPLDRFYIADMWETIGSLSNSLGIMVSESK